MGLYFGAGRWPSPDYHCLDEAFDAVDIEADHELCRAVAAGKIGLHPDGWGNHQSLNRPASRHGEYLPPVPPDCIPAAAWSLWPMVNRLGPKPQPGRKPGRPRKPWVPPPPPPPVSLERATGEIELTCDECRRRWGTTLYYRRGDRPLRAVQLRMLAGQKGWTWTVGRDRCPECSHTPAPEQVGNGTGTGQGDEQHADGG